MFVQLGGHCLNSDFDQNIQGVRLVHEKLMAVNNIIVQSLEKGAHVIVEISKDLREIMEEAHLKLAKLFTRLDEIIE